MLTTHPSGLRTPVLRFGTTTRPWPLGPEVIGCVLRWLFRMIDVAVVAAMRIWYNQGSSGLINVIFCQKVLSNWSLWIIFNGFSNINLILLFGPWEIYRSSSLSLFINYVAVVIVDSFLYHDEYYFCFCCCVGVGVYVMNVFKVVR